MQGWKATSKHGVQEKEAQKDKNMQEIKKNQQLIDVCLLILDLKSFRS